MPFELHKRTVGNGWCLLTTTAPTNLCRGGGFPVNKTGPSEEVLSSSPFAAMAVKLPRPARCVTARRARRRSGTARNVYFTKRSFFVSAVHCVRFLFTARDTY